MPNTIHVGYKSVFSLTFLTQFSASSVKSLVRLNSMYPALCVALLTRVDMANHCVPTHLSVFISPEHMHLAKGIFPSTWKRKLYRNLILRTTFLLWMAAKSLWKANQKPKNQEPTHMRQSLVVLRVHAMTQVSPITYSTSVSSSSMCLTHMHLCTPTAHSPNPHGPGVKVQLYLYLLKYQIHAL
jgi:hypothetical protein